MCADANSGARPSLESKSERVLKRVIRLYARQTTTQEKGYTKNPSYVQSTSLASPPLLFAVAYGSSAAEPPGKISKSGLETYLLAGNCRGDNLRKRLLTERGET
jgi:hypothetical protein